MRIEPRFSQIFRFFPWYSVCCGTKQRRESNAIIEVNRARLARAGMGNSGLRIETSANQAKVALDFQLFGCFFHSILRFGGSRRRWRTM